MDITSAYVFWYIVSYIISLFLLIVDDMKNKNLIMLSDIFVDLTMALVSPFVILIWTVHFIFVRSKDIVVWEKK